MKKTFAVILVALAAVISYAPATRDGFVWDDTALILRDPLIRSWRLIPEGFNHFLFLDATASDFYRPIQRLVYTLDYAAFAFQPAGYHLTSIFWHAAAAVALFFFAIEALLTLAIEQRNRGKIALLAALVWAVHPVHSAAVIYVSGLADPLAATFGFTACCLVLRSLRASGRAAILWQVAGGVFFLLSGLSKEIGFVFLALAIALLALTKNWRALWKTAIAAVFVCVIYLTLRIPAEHLEPPRMASAPLSVRPIMMARAFAEYAGLIVFPLNLHMDRQLDVRGPGLAVLTAAAWRELQTVAGLALIALMIYWAARARTRNPPVFVFLALAGISYLPISGLWLLNASVAEHWLYVPSAFLFLAVAVATSKGFASPDSFGVVDFAERKSWPRIVRVAAATLFAAWCVFLAARTFVRTFDWKDQRTFVERTIASGGNSVRMLINLGGLELSNGHLDLARQHLDAALKKDPNEPLAVLNRAAVALKDNDFKTARELLNRATQMPLVDARAHEYLAVLENKENGRADLMRMRLAARTGPSDWEIEKRYIRLLDETGSTNAAIKEVEHCLATEWYRAESWQFLGNLLKKAGYPDKAAQAFVQAEEYDVHLQTH